MTRKGLLVDVEYRDEKVGSIAPNGNGGWIAFVGCNGTGLRVVQGAYESEESARSAVVARFIAAHPGSPS